MFIIVLLCVKDHVVVYHLLHMSTMVYILTTLTY